MTVEEASIHLALSDVEDLHDVIESSIFKAKQELIQKADQVLLFAAKEKKWKLLQEAGRTLGFTFPTDSPVEVSNLRTDSMEAAFQSFHQQRASILSKLNQVNSFHGIIVVQQALLVNYLHWLGFWKDANTTMELGAIKLSSVIDSMRFLQWLISLKEQGKTNLSQLKEELIPKDIQHELCRLKILYKRLN